MDEDLELNEYQGMKEFIFPIKREQMMHESTEDKIYVNELLNIGSASNDERYNFIHNLSSAVGRKESLNKILENEHFDMLFSFVHYSSKCNASEKASILDVITRCKSI